MNKILPLLSNHYLGTLVTNKPDLLFDGDACLQFIITILKENNIYALNHHLHIFNNSSFTILVGLSESHISIHTWPERHTVQLDVFLCNYLSDNTKKGKLLYDTLVGYFGPAELTTKVIKRP